MTWRKIGKALLFPPMAIMLILIPITTVFLVCAMVFLGTRSIAAMISYTLAAYTLAIWCFKIPYLVRFFIIFKNENRYARLWQDNARFRVNVSLYGTLLCNTAYALLQLGLGFWHRTFWFCSLAGYYICLAVMRFVLVRHTSKHQAGEKMLEELIKYRACGIVLLLMNLALMLMVFFMVYWDRTFHHHAVTAIILATYTFLSLTVAIINTVKYRKYNSPVYSASKAISLAAACVSVLILESTLLTTFDKGSMNVTGRRILLGVSGGVICAGIIAMAVCMIVQGNKRIKAFRMKEK